MLHALPVTIPPAVRTATDASALSFECSCRGERTASPRRQKIDSPTPPSRRSAMPCRYIIVVADRRRRSPEAPRRPSSPTSAPGALPLCRRARKRRLNFQAGPPGGRAILAVPKHPVSRDSTQPSVTFKRYSCAAIILHNVSTVIRASPIGIVLEVPQLGWASPHGFTTIASYGLLSVNAA